MSSAQSAEPVPPPGQERGAALGRHVFARGRDLPSAVRAEGSVIWDADGRRYLDAAGGAIVVGIGHGDGGAAVGGSSAAAIAASARSSSTTGTLTPLSSISTRTLTCSPRGGYLYLARFRPRAVARGYLRGYLYR